MQFQVPQFIEVEDKIFGPFTFKQFIYIVGGFGLAFILWRYLPFLVAVPLIAGVGGISFALTMGKMNGRPFILGLESGFYYLISSKLYLWSHERKQKKKKEDIEKTVGGKGGVYVPTLSESRLHKLAWSLDIREKIERAGMRDVPDSAQGEVAQRVKAEEELVRIATGESGLVR